MIELRVRKRVDRLVNPIGRGLARIGVTPTWLTLIGLGVTVIGAVLVARESFVAGALVAITGAALDGLDGSVARARGSASLSGALLDSVADRMGETAMWAGLAFALSDSARLSLLCVLSLGASLLVSYVRGKAESLGADGRGGIMGRAERIILMTFGLLFIEYVEVMLWAMAALTWLTVLQRFYISWRQLEHGTP
ncbi:MAG: CDP-alcohol phosphatidyltransferase family protein [Acidimicrobiia bacterium]|nr:CDP-alcohol phosphatidyltransferase family protein [Acidimicrobiia bacterium]MDH5505087.1 CDP-alcohol phosphatidyltransferase family protein [Acidimicrobiia bacterium]